METHDEMIARWHRDPEYRKAYDALEEQFSWFDQFLNARTKAGLTQAEVAQRLGASVAAVGRLEFREPGRKRAPSIDMLHKYAAAVGCRVEIRFVPISPSSNHEPKKQRVRRPLAAARNSKH